MKLVRGCTGGIAVGVMALMPMAAQAQDTTTTTTVVTETVPYGTVVSAEPTLVTGTVLRYYVDRSGYVTAMDVQTANGVSMVRFAPGMGQRMMNTYPVGGQAAIWVQGSPYYGTTRWDVVGIGEQRPMYLMQPYVASDVDLLEATPMIMTGARMVTLRGKLTGLVTNPGGEVLGMILDNNWMVRVPREMRHIAPGHAGTERVTPLFRGSDVEVTGWPEAPRFGVLSRFTNRLAANAIVVNGRAVGALGFPLMAREHVDTLFRNVDVGGTRTNEEMQAETMGYSVYDPGSMSGPVMTTPSTTTTTTTTINP